MQKKLSPFNPVFAFLEKVFNLMLANVLFLLCSLPVITLGASLAGMLQVVQDQFYQEDQPVIRRFFRGFRKNFRQATLGWLMILLFLGAMGLNVLLVMTFAEGWISQLLYILLGLLTAVVLSLGSYLFPLMVRYDNSFHTHLVNSMILSVVKLPRTLIMLLLNTLIFWIPFFSMKVMVATMVFWMLLGFAFIAYSDMRLLKPVFRQMEEEDTVDLMT